MGTFLGIRTSGYINELEESHHELLERLQIVSEQLERERKEKSSLMETLQAVTKELGVERRRSTRLSQELEAIKAKKRVPVPVCPVENNNHPSYSPLTLFPEELWESILGTVGHPNDLESCAKSHNELKHILEPKKTQYLFPKVLKVVNAHLKYNPILKITSTDLRTLRLVCHFWKVSIDDCLQNCMSHHESYAPGHGKHTPLPPLYSRPHLFVKSPLTQLKSFVENPFPSRHVLLHEHDLDSPKHLVTQVLERFGTHVWYLSMRFHICNQDTYSTIIHWMQFLPNLQAIYWLQNTAILNGPVGSSDIPKLKQLKTLHARNIPEEILQVIFRNNGHLKTIRLDYANKLGIHNFDSVKLDGLHEFALLADNVPNLNHVTWPLRKLQLNLLCNGESLNGPQLFTFINKFSDTLTNLNVSVNVSLSETTLESALLLPNLEELKMTLCSESKGETFSADFLLCLRSLKYLSLVVRSTGIPLWRVEDYSPPLYLKGVLRSPEHFKVFTNLEYMFVDCNGFIMTTNNKNCR